MRINDKFKGFVVCGITIFFLFPIHQARGEVDIIKTKDGWNTAIPAAQGISNTKNIAAKSLTEKIDETYLIPLEEGTFEKARGFKGVYKNLFHLGRDYCVQKAGENKDGSLYGTLVYPIGCGIAVDLRFNKYPAKAPEKWKKGDGVGNYVTINHGNGIVAVYMHLAKVDVIKNQKLTVQTPLGEAGDIILHPNIPGEMCPHLHLEIRKNGVETLRVPPNLGYSYISQDGITKIEEGKRIGNVLEWIDLNFYDPDSILVARKTSPDSAMRILFVGGERVDSPYDHHLYSINPEGSGKREILPYSLSKYGRGFHLAISPNGKQLAVPSITVMGINGGEKRELPTPKIERLENLRWSPDGTRIAFEGSDFQYGRDIYVINADGTGLKRLTKNINPYSPRWNRENIYPTWKPDGKKIIFNNYSNDKWITYLINTDGAEQEQQVSAPYDYTSNLEFSPDGTKIAFRGPKGEVYVGRVKNTNKGIEITETKQLTKNMTKFSICRIRWSPDGTRIAFSGYGSPLFVINANGSNLRVIDSPAALIDWIKDLPIK